MGRRREEEGILAFGRELGNLSSVRGCLGVAAAAAPSGATVTSMGDEHHNNNVATVQTLDGSFNILDQSDQLRLLKEILQRHDIELKSTTPPAFAGGGGANGNNEIRPITVLNAISSLNTMEATRGNANDGDDVVAKMSKRVHKIATEIRVPFQRAKYSQNSVDFDDLILLTRELLMHHPEVREILHRRWRHVLVDEFQDTSRVQLDLVRLLTTNSLFVVGDGDQSIYSWRGASPESMSDFELTFHDRAHGWEELLSDDQEDVSKYLERIDGVRGGREVAPLRVKSVYLMENYRSTTNIVRAAQRIISTNSEKSNGANPTTSAQDEIRRDMKPMRGDGPSPRVLACKDGKAEAKFVVQTVISMVDRGDLSPSSTVAIIYRTNAQSRLLEEACVEDNLRYVVRGSSGTFYKRAEIQDCMAFLKIMYNPRDRSAWARAVKAPSRGIGETSLNEFFRYCDAVTEKYAELGRNDLPSPLDVMISFAPAVGASPIDISPIVPPKDIVSTRSMNRFVPFASSLRSLRRKGEAQTVSDFLLSVIDDLALKSHFDAISKTRDEYEDRLGNVMELVRAAERYKTDGPCISFSSVDEPMETPLGNFLDDVALIADIAPDELDSEDGGRIVANLMTIHSSKGMEFDAVFLVGNEEGTFPTQRSIAEGERSIELSEERRLCYVAMTRAKTHLVLTWRREVSFFSGAIFKSKDAVRSRFLDVLVSKQGTVPGKGGSHPSTQDKSNNLSFKNGTSRSGNVGSMTKREMHTEAKRLLASEGKSWGSWNPSSQKKTIRQIPSIALKSPANGVDQRPKLVLDQTRILSVRDSIDRRKVLTSPQSQTAQQSMVMRQNHHSSRNTSINVNAPKNQSQTAAGHSNVNQATLSGEPPPDDMDSTLFFPVGSSVKHKLHGRGVVQTPPNSDSEFSKKMLVRVKFIEESTEWDLPMDGLVHTYD
ncbi:hypothetical protein ACHAW5_000367 [Stephanodiscus triporus]|uniref:DNA 3'-5' helicase n=1 Tax=Stephanodiscus triporus TaxID=2934178 RepID=A0ABD3MX24_9STRA